MQEYNKESIVTVNGDNKLTGRFLDEEDQDHTEKSPWKEHEEAVCLFVEFVNDTSSRYRGNCTSETGKSSK